MFSFNFLPVSNKIKIKKIIILIIIFLIIILGFFRLREKNSHLLMNKYHIKNSPKILSKPFEKIKYVGFVGNTTQQNGLISVSHHIQEIKIGSLILANYRVIQLNSKKLILQKNNNQKISLMLSKNAL